MKRLGGLVFLILGCGWFPIEPAIASEGRLPNLVVLFADDLGYGELGCQGNPQIPTPHIDSISREGVRFTNGYVTASYCSSSRAGLLTGKFQGRFGYEFNPIGDRNDDPRVGLPATERTLAQHLRDAGYVTALIGKWHLGGSAAYHPSRRGFDEFFGFLHEGHYFVPPPYAGVTTMLRRKVLPGGGEGRWISPSGTLIYSTHMGSYEPAYDANNPILRGGQPVVEHEYLTDALTREAIDFIERRRDQPFFLYVAYNAVHSPLQGADRWMEKMASIEDPHRRIFAAMLGNLDESVGRILKTLDDEQLQRDTLVVFLSDNGGPTRELTSSNRPLRGGKGTLYEGGVRVPFMARWPGKIKAGTEYHRPVISLDLYATAAAISNSADNRLPQLDGVDLMPFLSGKSTGSPHETLYWRMNQQAALRHGDWKIVRPGRGPHGNQWQLFDLQNDVSEASDLAATHAEKLQQLVAIWDRYNAEMQDPFWSPAP